MSDQILDWVIGVKCWGMWGLRGCDWGVIGCGRAHMKPEMAGFSPLDPLRSRYIETCMIGLV